MELFDVYSLFDVTPVRAKGCTVWDDKGQEYLDLYGGHAVISVGHSHPHYVEALKAQLDKIGFYSNSVRNPLQEELARRIGEAAGYEDYALFLDNSGAESNENAAKLASFHTGKDRIIAFRRSFHGRTSGAVALTDNPAIVSPFNAHHRVTFLDLNDGDAVAEELMKRDVAAVIVEGIQGCGGIHVPTPGFLQTLSRLCRQYGAALILDEVQSGYGRTGKFFAHQWAGIRPDIITLGKGIANGFPCGGILIAPQFQARKGMLGTTFGPGLRGRPRGAGHHLRGASGGQCPGGRGIPEVPAAGKPPDQGGARQGPDARHRVRRECRSPAEGAALRQAHLHRRGRKRHDPPAGPAVPDPGRGGPVPYCIF